MTESGSIYEGFLRSARDFPHRPALEIANRVVSYSDLQQRAFQLAATLQKYELSDQPPLTAIFGYRSVTAFAGVLATLLRGHGYVPLNRMFPPERTKLMLERSGCRALVVDQLSAAQLPKVLEGFSNKLLILMPDEPDPHEFAARWPQHEIIGGKRLESGNRFTPVRGSPDDIAYLLFTSGSTGTPKGVMVSHRNVRSYVKHMVPRYGIRETDKCSQTFDLTFDLSVHDMFVTWERGACLCCPSQKALIKPSGFIVDSNLTIWFSVPSTAVFMKKLGLLKPNMYPNLRLTLFCGEGLPVDIVKAWAEAAPNSAIENLYGPTEATIACTAYRWEGNGSAQEVELDLVPIGEPFPHMEALIVDENLVQVPLGTPGELLVSGLQVALGYWQDSEKTARSFVVPSGQTKTYYRTGDRVRLLANGKPITYLGRVDNQIKVLGHRVELGEVEAALRQESGVDGAIALGWPTSPSGAGGIEAFLQTDYVDIPLLREKLAKRLPPYMVPRNIHVMGRVPLNSNGKFDRQALIQILEKQQDETHYYG
jgi:amino acid adenylation domain-containing protein